MANNTRQHSEQYSFLQTCREQFASTAILARDIQNERSSLRRSSSTNTNFNGADIMNSDSNGVTKDFVVGIDYGTTFTSVSYFVYSNADGTRHAKISDVKTIKNWPDDPTCGSAEQVPTETWYSKIPLQRSPLVDQYDDPASSLQLQDGTLEAVPSQDENVDPNDIEENDGMDTDESTEFLWGYTVHYQMYIARTTRNLNRHIPRPKLMLVNTSYTQKDRLVLRHQLNQLIKKGLIRKYGKRHEPDDRDVRDVIADFLIKVFQHTKEQLVEYEGLRDHCKVDFVITVPTIWSQESSRVLQVCVEDAIRATGFGRLTNESISNLFIIPEPEAAATFLLGNSHAMLPGQTVIIMDCGGGTVDGVTYSIDTSYPLRLKDEAVEPGGDNCGGSYLNENYRDQLLVRLKDEAYLDQNGETRRTLVNKTIPNFETYDKRKKDVTRKPVNMVDIAGLKGDAQRGLTGHAAKRFEPGRLLMNWIDYEIIFVPLLMRVETVLRNQLEAAMAKGKVIKTVFLIGGFGGAPSLRSYLKQLLLTISTELKLPYNISLVENPKNCVTAVSSGSVIRALDKENGPKRHIQSSYGFLRKEPHQPDAFRAHKSARSKKDAVDGEYYLKVINYFMIKGELVQSIHTYEPLKTYHTFEIDTKDLLCEELLYVSDTATQSHYTLSSRRNKDAQLAGRIIVDMSFLRDKKLIQPIEPDLDVYGDLKGVPHWRVEYDLVAVVEGRNLRYEARWPANKSGKAQKIGQVSIAAAFKPGTG